MRRVGLPQAHGGLGHVEDGEKRARADFLVEVELRTSAMPILSVPSDSLGSGRLNGGVLDHRVRGVAPDGLDTGHAGAVTLIMLRCGDHPAVRSDEGEVVTFAGLVVDDELGSHVRSGTRMWRLRCAPSVGRVETLVLDADSWLQGRSEVVAAVVLRSPA